jgi:voltage-gated potassium channel
VLKNKREEIYSTLAIGAMLLIASSCSAYFLENPFQPEVFSSIPASMWWGVVTLTTVGYGDISPVSPARKVLGSLIAFLGIGMFALPAGIIASGFSEEIQNRKNRKGICPHCGRGES